MRTASLKECRPLVWANSSSHVVHCNGELKQLRVWWLCPASTCVMIWFIHWCDLYSSMTVTYILMWLISWCFVYTIQYTMWWYAILLSFLSDPPRCTPTALTRPTSCYHRWLWCSVGAVGCRQPYGFIRYSGCPSPGCPTPAYYNHLEVLVAVVVRQMGIPSLLFVRCLAVSDFGWADNTALCCSRQDIVRSATISVGKLCNANCSGLFTCPMDSYLQFCPGSQLRCIPQTLPALLVYK